MAISESASWVIIIFSGIADGMEKCGRMLCDKILIKAGESA
jgi:DNA-binding transcriptional MocR family regulator